MTDLTVACRAAITDLEWLNTIPHTLDQILGLHGEAHRGRPLRHGLTNAEILASISGGGGPGGSGHSDPTANAALRGEPDAIDDPDIGAIDAALALVAETARSVAVCVAEALGQPRRSPIVLPGRQAAIQRAIVDLQCAMPGVGTAEALGAHMDNGLAYSVVAIVAESSSWLQRKAEGMWLASHGERATPATQRTITGCARCSTWRTGTIAVRRGLCAQCATFQDANKCLATEAIVRRWEYGCAATPGQIAEAKAASRPRRKRTA